MTSLNYLCLAILIIGALSTIQVYSPACATQLFQKPIAYTLSNFGVIPYGEVIIGKIQLPNKEQLCSLEGENMLKSNETNRRNIILVKRGGCKFTEKVINAQKLGADLIVIYDNETGILPSVIMKNDGHGHLSKIPSMLISNQDGLRLKKSIDTCKTFPTLKVEFEIDQALVSNVILWLDAKNRESFVLARQFYREDYYQVLKNYVNFSIGFRIQSTCVNQEFCKKTDCIGTFTQKYCRNVEVQYESFQTRNKGGKDIIQQQLREYFLWEELQNNDKMLWWEYMSKFDKQDCIETVDCKDCSFTAMKAIKINDKTIAKIDSLVKETISNVTQGKTNILRQTYLQSKQLGVYFYPQATINKRNFYGLFKAPQVFKAICQSLISPPSQCITFVKNNHRIDIGEEEGITTAVIIILIVMTIGFLTALCIYTRSIRKEVDQQLSLEVNKMVQNYVDLAEKKKKNSEKSGSYVKIQA